MTQSKDHPAEFRHIDDMAWETLRFPGQHSKMLFHPRPECPTEPNAGFVRYEAGAHHPLHRHDFAQVWYVLEGTFRIGETSRSFACPASGAVSIISIGSPTSAATTRTRRTNGDVVVP